MRSRLLPQGDAMKKVLLSSTQKNCLRMSLYLTNGQSGACDSTISEEPKPLENRHGSKRVILMLRNQIQRGDLPTFPLFLLLGPNFSLPAQIPFSFHFPFVFVSLRFSCVGESPSYKLVAFFESRSPPSAAEGKKATNLNQITEP